MAFLLKTWKGLVFILALLVINSFIWLGASPLISQSIESKIGQIMASNIIIIFSVVFFLSTKNTFVTWLFNGIENVYIYHRFLAILAIIMIFIHSQLTYLIFQYYRPDLPIRPATMAVWARNLFIFLVVFALLAKYMNYERWRILHRFMIVPFLMGVYHAVFISSYNLLSFSLLGIWMQVIILVGVFSSLYMIVMYRRTAFPHKGKVVNVHYPTKDVTELTIELSEDYNFKHGQFAFIKIGRQPFNGVPHPFSISGGLNNRLTFTIKALGDFTDLLREQLETGDIVQLSKPYGHMTFKDYKTRQVWIAGGIGITPFLSYLRNEENLKQNITLYYSVKSIKDAIHLDLFESLEKTYPHFTYELWESNKKGYLSVSDINLEESPTVFMCGPVAMARALKKEFRKSDEQHELVYEAFSFTGTIASDIENLFRKFLTKVKK